jgi:hypothetical protein
MTDPLVDQLLSAGRRERASAESRARALALVGAGAAAGAAVAASRSATTLTTTVKVTLVVAALAGGAWVATRAREKPGSNAPVAQPSAPSRVEPTKPASAAVVVLESSSAIAVPSAAPSPAPKKVVTAAAPSSAPSSKPAPIDDAAAELALVSSAHAALQSGDPQGALTQLATWRERYKGVYAEEAEAIEVDALVASGAKERAAKSAARFVERWPHSPHTARMQALTTEP